jgi:hypothetical protein
MPEQHSFQRFKVNEIARSFPDTAETLLLDTYLTKRLTVHALPDILEESVVFLSFDTPRRDPKDIIFVKPPEDGTPETFIRRKEE